MNGSDEERRLARWFADDGWCVMRSPSSGGGTQREQADLLVGHPVGPVYAIEMKTTGRGSSLAYVDEEEVIDLKVAGKGFGAEPRLVSRWGGDKTFYAYHPDDLHRTDGGNYALRKDQRDEGETFPPDVE